MVDIVPIDIPEEGMGHDLLGIRWPRAKSELRLASKKLLKNGHRVPRHVDGIERLIGQNSIVDFVFIFTTEGRLLQQHLVDEHTEGPPINCAAIFLVQKNLYMTSGTAIHDIRFIGDGAYLGCHELRGTTECARSCPIPHVLLAKTVISNLDMTVQGQKNVIKLQVTVDNTVLVEVFECQQHFRSVEPVERVSFMGEPDRSHKITNSWIHTVLFSGQTGRAECGASDHHH